MPADDAGGMRLLEERDEAAFQALLRAVYGETYAYRALYEAGGVAALIRSGRAALWGDFGPRGELSAHTAFLFKDPRGDYVESGMSFRDARASRRTSDAIVWARLFAWLEDRCVFVHQNTSSWHPLAQRYAHRYMRARPTGVIIDYVIGEQLTGIVHPATPMQALTMTSVVRPDRLPPPSRRRLVPSGPWGAWLTGVFGALGLTGCVEARAEPPPELGLDDVEQNPALSLVRRVVVRRPGAPPFEAMLAEPKGRVDLVHLPCDERMGATPALSLAGFIPVGVRPHATREDEVILQRLPGERRRDAMDALAAMELAPAGRALVEGWRSACARTS